MTRLPSDSFLPLGAMDAELQASPAGLAGSIPSSSIISPLALPGGVQYFDPAARPAATSHPGRHVSQTSNPHVNGDARDPPQAQPAGFLSPHLTPIPSHAQHHLQFQRHTPQRAASLSPTRGPIDRRRDRKVPGKPNDVDFIPRKNTSSKVTVPVDTISGTGSGLITVRRPAVRANCAPDSASIDSQTSAADQEYRRIEKLRQAFDNERRVLQASRDMAEEVYKEIIEELETEHTRQKSQWETDRYKLQMQVMQLQNRLKDVESRVNAAEPNLAAVQPVGPSHSSPTGQPDICVSFSRDRCSGDSAAMDFGLPSKVIDVQECYKDLEGIHLKENAVKKETFTDSPSDSSSRTSSGRISPPQNPEGAKLLARARSMRAMRADANSRLTINAGHTPTISLSISATNVSNTVVSSGSNTPTLMSGDGGMSSDENNRDFAEPVEPVPTGIDDEIDPAIMDTLDEDLELKGPLTLRNMPAKDEAFLRRLSDKLQRVGSGEDATPAVLKHADEEAGDTEGPDANAQPADADGNAEDEEDIPLKIRNTCSNFGKPFGVV